MARSETVNGIFRIVAAMLPLVSATFVFTGCNSGSGKENSNTAMAAYTPPAGKSPSSSDDQIPVLCYHQVRDWKGSDSKSNRVYIMPVARFKEQMKMLHDSGYHTISPDQLIDFIKNGTQLPDHPMLLTFDDATLSQYTNALPELNKNGFKATFFIMTVVLDHADYMSKKDLAALAQQGHTIGCHTWDHRSVTKYNEKDWTTELEKPTAELEQITGKPVRYFAYPDGLWDTAAVNKLIQYKYTAAFQLWDRDDHRYPLYTIKRILVSGDWSNAELMNAIHRVEIRHQKTVAVSKNERSFP